MNFDRETWNYYCETWKNLKEEKCQFGKLSFLCLKCLFFHDGDVSFRLLYSTRSREKSVIKNSRISAATKRGKDVKNLFESEAFECSLLFLFPLKSDVHKSGRGKKVDEEQIKKLSNVSSLNIYFRTERENHELVEGEKRK